MKTKELQAICKEVLQAYKKTAWSKGVNEYAEELLEKLVEDYEETNQVMLQKQLLNGAASWHQYSWDGCSLIYDEDIALRLCNNSELKKNKNGRRKPNKNEEWLDVQGRALFQAYRRIRETLIVWNKI